MDQSVSSAASMPAAMRFPDPPIGRPLIVTTPEPYHDAGSVPPTGPPGHEGEWNPIDGGTTPGTTPGTMPGPGAPVGGSQVSERLLLMLAIARALGPAVSGAGLDGQVSAQSLADALRGLANMIDPSHLHGSPSYGPPTHRFPPGSIGSTPAPGLEVAYPPIGDSQYYKLAARRNG